MTSESLCAHLQKLRSESISYSSSTKLYHQHCGWSLYLRINFICVLNRKAGNNEFLRSTQNRAMHKSSEINLKKVVSGFSALCILHYAKNLTPASQQITTGILEQFRSYFYQQWIGDTKCLLKMAPSTIF